MRGRRTIGLSIIIFFLVVAASQILKTPTAKRMFSVLAPGKQRRSWQEIAQEKRQANMAKIPMEWILDDSILEEAKSRQSIHGEFIESLLDEETRRITAMDVTEIVQHMRNASLTAVETVTAFSKRAAYAHQLSQILLEVGFDIALKRAEELDAYFRANGELLGPLHGVPITVKDQFHIKGLETTMGFVGWIGTFEGLKDTGKEKSFESELIREFYTLGAVPIGKTSVVQALRGAETNNNILGYVWNPYNQRLSVGGSSGGEGCMQALRGSCFGIGTDIGGSVSIPASFNGIFSIKPSVGRIPAKGMSTTGPGQQIIPTAIGIMGTSLDTLRLVFKSVLSAKPWLHDPAVIPIPWRDELQYDAKKELTGYKPTFGLMKNDGIVAPHPPIARALEIVQKALQDAGYNIINWEPPSNDEVVQIHKPILRGDGAPDIWHDIQLSGEPIVPEIAHVFPDGKPVEPIPLPDYEQVVIHMVDYRQRYQSYWESTSEKTENGYPVEAVIAPVSPYAAVLPGKFYYSAYSNFVNVVDSPAVVIPVTFADKEIDRVPKDWKPMSDNDKKNMDSYDPNSYHGAPAAIQLIGKRLDEERLLSLAGLIVDAMHSNKDG